MALRTKRRKEKAKKERKKLESFPLGLMLKEEELRKMGPPSWLTIFLPFEHCELMLKSDSIHMEYTILLNEDKQNGNLRFLLFLLQRKIHASVYENHSGRSIFIMIRGRANLGSIIT